MPDVVQFTFTHIDATNPNKPFSITLDASNPQGCYFIRDCQPPLDQNVIDSLLHNLNQTDDLRKMLRDTRKAFKIIAV